MTISAHALNSEEFKFEYEDQNITIVFEENTVYTNDERQYIADLLVYGNDEPESTSTYAWCWLTGHDLTSESVAEIQHKVSDTEPRCRRTIYKVESCSKCDHVEITDLGSTYIPCCPED